MSPKTLFLAYKAARNRMENARNLYGAYRSGIAISDEDYARKYQRYLRLATRIEYRFEGEPVCPLCVATGGWHYSHCKRSE